MTLHARRSACVISSHNLSHTSTTTGASPCVVHDIVPHVVLLQFCRSKVSESACMSVCATACACVLACMRACIVSVCVSMHVHVSVLCVCFLVWACALCWVWGKDEALLCYNVHFIRIVLHCEMTLQVSTPIVQCYIYPHHSMRYSGSLWPESTTERTCSLKMETSYTDGPEALSLNHYNS